MKKKLDRPIPYLNQNQWRCSELYTLNLSTFEMFVVNSVRLSSSPVHLFHFLNKLYNFEVRALTANPWPSFSQTNNMHYRSKHTHKRCINFQATPYNNNGALAKWQTNNGHIQMCANASTASVPSHLLQSTNWTKFTATQLKSR